jgi:hypothetical protein
VKRETFEDKLRALTIERIQKIPDCYFPDTLKSAEWLGVKVPAGGSSAVGFVGPTPHEEDE